MLSKMQRPRNTEHLETSSGTSGYRRASGRSNSSTQACRGSIDDAIIKSVPSEYMDWLKALQKFNDHQIADLIEKIQEVNKQLGCKDKDELFYELCLDSDDSDEESLSLVKTGSDSPRYPKRNVPKKNYTEESDSDDDDYVLTEAHRCSTCGRLFSSAAFLQGHQRRYQPNDGEKKWKCDHCSYSTNIHTHFKNHQLTHTKEKPFKCTECGRAFGFKLHLRRHLLTHTQEKPHKCDFCGRGFTQNGALKMHQRTHFSEKPFICEECGKAFTRSRDLSRHRLIHTGQNPFKCPHCSRRFNRKSSMNRHVECHDSELK